MLEYLRRFLNLGNARRGRTASRELALRAEACARRLSGLSPRPEAAPGETEDALLTACQLLERLAEEDKRPGAAVPPVAERPPAPEKVSPSGHSPAAPRPSVESRNGVMTTTAKEIIKLRDWVLLAKSDKEAQPGEALEYVYRKLAHVLKKEGVTPLEEAGMFNSDRQRVVDTRPTEDPALNHAVCHTVRPGYVFNDDIVRQQDVVIFRASRETSD